MKASSEKNTVEKRKTSIVRLHLLDLTIPSMRQ